MLRRGLPCALGSYVVNQCLVPDWWQSQYRDDVHRHAKEILKRATQAACAARGSEVADHSTHPLTAHASTRPDTHHLDEPDTLTGTSSSNSTIALDDLRDEDVCAAVTPFDADGDASCAGKSVASEAKLSLDAANALVATFVHRHDEESLGEAVQYIRETLQQPLNSFHYHALLRSFSHNLDHASAVQLLEVMTTRDAAMVSLETYARVVDAVHCLAPSDVWERILAICDVAQRTFRTLVRTIPATDACGDTSAGGGEWETMRRLMRVMAPSKPSVPHPLQSGSADAHEHDGVQDKSLCAGATTRHDDTRVAHDSGESVCPVDAVTNSKTIASSQSDATHTNQTIHSSSSSSSSSNTTATSGRHPVGGDASASPVVLRSAPVLTSLLHHIACRVDSGGPVAALLVALWIRCLGVPLSEWDCAFVILSLLSQPDMFPLVRALMSSFADCPRGVVRPATVLQRVMCGRRNTTINDKSASSSSSHTRQRHSSLPCTAGQTDGANTHQDEWLGGMGLKLPSAVYDVAALMQRALTEAQVCMTAEVHVGVMNCRMTTIDGWVNTILALTQPRSASSVSLIQREPSSQTHSNRHNNNEDISQSNDVSSHTTSMNATSTNLIADDYGDKNDKSDEEKKTISNNESMSANGVRVADIAHTHTLTPEAQHHNPVAVSGVQTSLLLRHTAMLVYSTLRDHTRAVQLFIEGEADACAATPAWGGCVARHVADCSTLVHRVSQHTRRTLQPSMSRIVGELRAHAARSHTSLPRRTRCRAHDDGCPDREATDSSVHAIMNHNDHMEHSHNSDTNSHHEDGSYPFSPSSSSSSSVWVHPMTCLGVPAASPTPAELSLCDNFWLTRMPRRREAASLLHKLAALVHTHTHTHTHTSRSYRLSRAHRSQLKQVAAYCAHHPFRNCKLTAAGLEERVKWAHYLDARDIALSLFGSARQARDSMKQLYYHQNQLPALRSCAMTARDVRDVGRIFFPAKDDAEHAWEHGYTAESVSGCDEAVVQAWTRQQTTQPHTGLSRDVVPRHLWDEAVYNPYPHIKLRRGVGGYEEEEEEDEHDEPEYGNECGVGHESVEEELRLSRRAQSSPGGCLVETSVWSEGATAATGQRANDTPRAAAAESSQQEDLFATLWRVLMSCSGSDESRAAATTTSSSSSSSSSSTTAASVWYLQDSEMYVLLMRCLLHRLDWEAAVHLTVKMQTCNHYSYAMDHELTTIFSEIGDPAGCLAFKVATKLFDGRINRDGQTRRDDFHKTHQQKQEEQEDYGV